MFVGNHCSFSLVNARSSLNNVYFDLISVLSKDVVLGKSDQTTVDVYFRNTFNSPILVIVTLQAVSWHPSHRAFSFEQVFRSSLYPPDYQSRLDIVRANSKSPVQRTGSLKSSLRTVQVRKKNLMLSHSIKGMSYVEP